MILARIPILLSHRAASVRALPERHDDDSRDDELAGCGWFDSSFELKQGLEVRELAWSEANPAAFMGG